MSKRVDRANTIITSIMAAVNLAYFAFLICSVVYGMWLEYVHAAFLVIMVLWFSWTLTCMIIKDN